MAERFELSRGGAFNFRTMEGLRGFAVFLVFLVHFSGLYVLWVSKKTNLEYVLVLMNKVGNVGVDLFFVLSGYLIYKALISREQKFLTFMWRRICRIYPAFTVVFVVYVFLSFCFPAESKIPKNIVGGALYLAENYFLLPGIFKIEPMVTVAWSLSYEMFYYFTIPLMISLMNMRGWNRNRRVSLFFGIVIVFFFIVERKAVR